MTRRLHHPGPPVADRILSARGQVTERRITLPRGAILMEAVAEAMDAAGCDSGLLDVTGLRMGPYAYVMPGPSKDAAHAAWYSDTHLGNAAHIDHGTAIVGRRDGVWWLHCHARWVEAGSSHMGHLLPDRVTLAQDAQVTLQAFTGGAFAVQHDPETNFPIFHTTGGQDTGNAVIARIAPHEDIHAALTTLIADAGFDRARVHGIGSLIGAQFVDAPAMASPISEVVIPGAGVFANGALALPMACVDPAGGMFTGMIRPGTSPVCVTFEALVVEG